MSAAWHFENGALRIRKAEVGTLGNNCYVLACRQTSESLIVDAAADAASINDLAAGTTPRAIVTTHGHADHVGAAREVARRFGIPILLHHADWQICPIPVETKLEPGELVVGATSVTAVHTPGHTPGSMCLKTAGAVVTGDTLFPGGPGATRFPYSDFDQIMDSLERELFTMPDDTVVMPGHGLDTTIGEERPELPTWRARRW